LLRLAERTLETPPSTIASPLLIIKVASVLSGQLPLGAFIR
jgi:hypothetical protein